MLRPRYGAPQPLTPSAAYAYNTLFLINTLMYITYAVRVVASHSLIDFICRLNLNICMRIVYG